MFRSATGKFLCRMFDHPVVHDLSTFTNYEIGLIFLLMSIAGGSTSPETGYGFNGAMSMQFRNPDAAINALRSHGYLTDEPPFDALVENMTVAHLKDILRAHGMPVSGKRAELIERLSPIITEDELVELRKMHSYWCPSALGYEMIYSLYDLWERRQLAFMDALAANDYTAICAAYQHMPCTVGFWDDTQHNFLPDKDKLNDVKGVSNTAASFFYLCGFQPEFYIRDMSNQLGDDFDAALMHIERNRTIRELGKYRAQGIKKVEWISCSAFPECGKRNGKLYSIDQVPACPTKPGCFCSVCAVFDDEAAASIQSHKSNKTYFPSTKSQTISKSSTNRTKRRRKKSGASFLATCLAYLLLALCFIVLLSSK